MKLFFEKQNILFALTFFLFLVGVLFLDAFEGIKNQNLTSVVLQCAAFSFLFSIILFLFDFQKKAFFLYLLFIFLYVSTFYLTKPVGLFLPRQVMSDVIGASVISFGVCLVCLCAAKFYKNKALSLLSTLLLFMAILPALVFFGYYIASGGYLFSATVLLTLFQTNAAEAQAYLSDQKLWLWALGILFIFLFFSAFVFIFLKIKPEKNHSKIFAFTLVCSLASAVFALPHLDRNLEIGVPKIAWNTLQSFNAYRQDMEKRVSILTQKADALKPLQTGGLYVVVIGESLNRKHMSAFGYARQTTPFLDSLAQNENVVFFDKAYSSHSHTVPSLQFALTGQNQYNESALSDVYSLTELARAAGFESWWISNQGIFNYVNIPLAVFADAANHRLFINKRSKTLFVTSYLDEKLSEYFPDVDERKNSLIIFHLMGCHTGKNKGYPSNAVYDDRYPKTFAVFKGKNSRVDSYDNAVLYTDYVLSKIYEKAASHKNFMGLAFFSDHGEDVDHDLAHDASKFTYEMAEIPLVFVFSSRFVNGHRDLAETLRNNADKYWTSDLFYDVFVHILGIRNAPDVYPQFDVASPFYEMSKENLKTLHGQKPLSDVQD